MSYEYDLINMCFPAIDFIKKFSGIINKALFMHMNEYIRIAFAYSR